MFRFVLIASLVGIFAQVSFGRHADGAIGSSNAQGEEQSAIGYVSGRDIAGKDGETDGLPQAKSGWAIRRMLRKNNVKEHGWWFTLWLDVQYLLFTPLKWMLELVMFPVHFVLTTWDKYQVWKEGRSTAAPVAAA